MRRIGLLLLLILVECCVAQEFCGLPKDKCKKKGIKVGVTAYCLPKIEKNNCPGKFYDDKIYCKNPNKQECGCCVPNKVRLCAAGIQGINACNTMLAGNPALGIICVPARDRYQCLQYLHNKKPKVDAVHGDAHNIYLASELYDGKLSVIANTRDESKENDNYQYGAVAVVRRSSINGVDDLTGKKSCHTGYDKTAGWYVPLSKLLEMDQLSCKKSLPVVEQNLNAFSSYFGEACIPGMWSQELKDKYSNLCSLCHNPDTCSAEDAYAGYEGALKCLTTNGDVAWTKLEAVEDFFKNREDSSKFGILCTNGTIIDLDSEDPCYWAEKPWPGWLTRVNEDTSVVLTALKDALSAAQSTTPIKHWAEDVLGVKKRSVIKELLPPLSPKDYLEQAGYYITISKPGCNAYPAVRARRSLGVGATVKFCVKSKIANRKCKQLSEVLTSLRVAPSLTCVKRKNCINAVANGNADIVTLDGGDVFSGYRDEGNIPVMSEVNGAYASSYFAVAVVRANSGITKLAELKDKNSCHTGIGKTAGWNIPLMTLLNASLLDIGNCDYTGQVGNFFNNSCAPGALDPIYNPGAPNPPSLCELCVGEGEDRCVRNSDEPFYGYDGAFKCLVEGGGDVAFVKHITVPENTDGKGEQPWNAGLDSSNFQLLCIDNRTAKVDEYKSCNLAKVPSHKVVTGKDSDVVLQTNIRTLLLQASEKLPPNQNDFAMFGVYGTHDDVLFKNSATSLANFDETAFDELKDGTYWKALETLDGC